MEKFCIFCGQYPEDKNKEHVIPQWLIERTGDPKRVARFGMNFQKDPPEFREFSFDALTFPACSKCNSDFSDLEERAKTVVEALLGHQALSQIDFSTLLDWLDKVRVGLWLGYLYLDRNPLAIVPKFHIAGRVGKIERTVVVAHVKERKPGINFVGPESPAFQGSPTCFALLINEWCLLNISGLSSCSRRLGLPYASPRHLRDDGNLEVTIEGGTGRIMRPVQKDLVFPNAVLLHQPIFRSCFIGGKPTQLLDTEPIRAQSLDWANGYGAVFLEKLDSVRKYSDGKNLDWLPEGTWSLRETYRRTVPYIYRRLISDLREGARLSGRERRKQMLTGIAAFNQVHDAILRGLLHHNGVGQDSDPEVLNPNQSRQ